LVVAAGGLTDDHGLLWVNMITSAENRSWSADVSLDCAAAGLPAASVVRVRKLATIEASDAEIVGHIGESEFSEVLRRIAGVLNI
jgi:mRNA interferase MazF